MAVRQKGKRRRWTGLGSAALLTDPDRGDQSRNAQERFRLFVDTVQDYAIFMLDTQGRVISWNQGAERMKGYQASEIIGKHFSLFYSRKDRESGKPEQHLALAKSQGRFETVGWRTRKDGTRFWAVTTITPLRDTSGAFIAFGKITRDLTPLRRAESNLRKEILEKRQAEKRLEQSEQSLRELSLHLLTSHDEERRRVGRELHDRVGQYLVALKMNLEALRSQCAGAPAFADSLRLLDASISEVRTLSYLLFPPLLEESGLKAAIQWYLDGFASRSGARTSFNSQEGVGRLSPEVELTLFRVLQESLPNGYRHSGARSAQVQLRKEGNTVELVVKDEGKTTCPRPANQGSRERPAVGIALRGMKERLMQLGGVLEVSFSKVGTFVRAVVTENANSIGPAAPTWQRKPA